VFCTYCQSETRKFGKNKSGSQRHRCDTCRKTFTDESTRPVDRRKLSEDDLIQALRMVLEGNSVRSTARLTGIDKDTIVRKVVEVGLKCKRFLSRFVAGVKTTDVQADEIWGFVKCKDRTRQRLGLDDFSEVGDVWTFVAIDRTTKLVLTHHVDKRTPQATVTFSRKLWAATSGRFQLSTDGYHPYRDAIPNTLGTRVDHGVLIKKYGKMQGTDPATRYSPPTVIGIERLHVWGSPDANQICTSHAERTNLTLRMGIRRLTRLTNGHSKKWDNHVAAMGLFFAYYNVCRVHSTLKTTPAVAAGLTDRVWSVKELLARIEG
jgi:transposase-like protein/IS1 family transposase